MLIKHPFSHVIVFRAAFQFHVWFDGDFFREGIVDGGLRQLVALPGPVVHMDAGRFPGGDFGMRSEEHTSELQSRGHLVCRLLLEKKKTTATRTEYAPGDPR